MVQRFLAILLVFFMIHLVGGLEASAVTARQKEASAGFRPEPVVRKAFKQNLKAQHTMSFRCRVPQVFKTAYSRNIPASAFLPVPASCSNDSSPSAPAGADSAYILGLIYPFHGFL